MEVLKFNEKKPDVGDYVICNFTEKPDEADLNDFVSENIGKILKNRNTTYKNYPYIVQYENFPYHLSVYTVEDDKKSIPVKTNEIVYWSRNKEEILTILRTMKFNI